MAKPNYATMRPNPMLVNVWRKSLSEVVELKLDERAAFQALRFQLYQTRKILEAQGDPLWETIRNFSITSRLDKASGQFTLSIGPASEKIAKLLEAQGFGGEVASDLDDLDPTKED
jgi:hypothetical protein